MTSSISTIPQPLAFHQSNSVVNCAPFLPKLGGVGSFKIRNGTRLMCNCSLTQPGGSGSGYNESKSSLDAFFLGKAVAETLNQRIESTVGEIRSTFGRLLAEQQKQVQEFQDEVLERAKRAKKNEVLERAKRAKKKADGQGFPVKSTTTDMSTMNSTSTISSAARPSTTTVKRINNDSESGKDDTVIGISNNL